MVATVLTLRFRMARHQLRREWWRALLLVGGLVWSLSLIPAVIWMGYVLELQSPGAREQIVVGFAAVCLLGWIAVPLLVTGLEDSLEPSRFATLGVPARALMPGLTAAAALTVPTLFFAGVFVVVARSWREAGTGTLVVAVAGSLLTVAVMVLAARVAVAWSARGVSSRRARLGTLAVLAGMLAAVVPAGWLSLRDGLDSAVTYELPSVLEWLGRTPVGAGVSAPGAFASGDTGGAVWRLALMVLTVVVLYRAWQVNVAYALVHPSQRGGGARRRADAILASSRPATRLGGDGITQAVRARALMSWATDPRHIVSALGVVVLPVLFFAVIMPLLGLDERWAFAAPILLAASIGWGRHNDVAFDSSALWMDVTAGQVGRQVMVGRMGAVLVWAAPAVAVAALAMLAWSGRWDAAPGLVGACIGALGTTLGMAALTSVLMPYRAPGPGENPFGAEVGSVGASLVAQVASGAAMFAILPLVTVPFVLALTVSAGWGWVALVAGTGLGVVGYVAGTRAAGIGYDRRSGKLLSAVS